MCLPVEIQPDRSNLKAVRLRRNVVASIVLPDVNARIVKGRKDTTAALTVGNMINSLNNQCENKI